MILGAVILLFSIVTSINIFQVKAKVNIGVLGRVLVGGIGVIILIIGVGMRMNSAPAQPLNAAGVAKYCNTGGVALYDQGKYREAESKFSEAVRLEPNDAIFHNNLGYNFHKQRKYQEADSQYTEAVRLDPNSALFRNNLGNSLYSQRRYRESESQYIEAVRLEPKNTTYRDNLRNAISSQQNR